MGKFCPHCGCSYVHEAAYCVECGSEREIFPPPSYMGDLTRMRYAAVCFIATGAPILTFVHTMCAVLGGW